MEITIEKLKEKISWYCNRFLLDLQSSEIYALYPQGNEYGWPAEYPNSRHAGIYAMLDKIKMSFTLARATTLGTGCPTTLHMTKTRDAN